MELKVEMGEAMRAIGGLGIHYIRKMSHGMAYQCQITLGFS